ncbi:MAG: S41 family peptidase [Candidatus Marinamargulisbacteria bacterium]
MINIVSALIILIFPLNAGSVIQPLSDHLTIQIDHFSSNVVSQSTWQYLRNVTPIPPAPLLVDLRNNPGGYLHDALRFSATFVTQNHLIQLRHSHDMTAITRPLKHPYFPVSRIIILVNEHTASAAEAGAYVLSHHPNAVIIGTNTLGKSKVTSTQKSKENHDEFQLPHGHIIPNIFFRFPSSAPTENVYLSAIQMAHQYLNDRDSKNRSERTIGK